MFSSHGGMDRNGRYAQSQKKGLGNLLKKNKDQQARKEADEVITMTCLGFHEHDLLYLHRVVLNVSIL